MSDRRHDDWPLGQGSVDPTPWPGTGPIETPAVSGQLMLQQPGGTLPRPTTFAGVVSWRSQRGPMPVVLTIDVASLLGATAANPYAAEQILFTQLSGLQLGGAAQPAGVMRVSYGFGAAIRTLEADLRSGSYQLPAVDFVTVDALVYGLGPITAKVSAAVCPGVIHSASARFTATWKPTINATQTLTEQVPFGARWVALSGGAPSGIGANQPFFTLTQAGGGICLMHDFINGVFVSQPGQPVELVSRGAVSLLNGGAAAAAAHVKFFLEV